jgi:hypothetical protein
VHSSFFGKLPRTPELFIRGTGENMTVETIVPSADNRTDRAKAADRSIETRRTTVKGCAHAIRICAHYSCSDRVTDDGYVAVLGQKGPTTTPRPSKQSASTARFRSTANGAPAFGPPGGQTDAVVFMLGESHSPKDAAKGEATTTGAPATTLLGERATWRPWVPRQANNGGLTRRLKNRYHLYHSSASAPSGSVQQFDEQPNTNGSLFVVVDDPRAARQKVLVV